MKARIIQLLLALFGIGFFIGHEPIISAVYVAGSFVVYALREDRP